MIFKTKYSKAVALCFSLLMAVHIVAYALSLYYVIPWLDNAMHFWGGISIALFFVWFFYFSGRFSGVSQAVWFVLLLSLGGVALVAVGWEFFEFIGNNTFAEGVFQGDLPDTMGDLFLALLGGLLVVTSLLPKIKKENQQQIYGEESR